MMVKKTNSVKNTSPMAEALGERDEDAVLTALNAGARVDYATMKTLLDGHTVTPPYLIAVVDAYKLQTHYEAVFGDNGIMVTTLHDLKSDILESTLRAGAQPILMIDVLAHVPARLGLNTLDTFKDAPLAMFEAILASQTWYA